MRSLGKMNITRVAISDLLATGTPIHPHEAAAIVGEVCAQVGRQNSRPRTVPLLEALVLDATGGLTARETGAFSDAEIVPHIGRMLRQLLANRGFAQAPVAGERLLAVAARAVDREIPVLISVKALGDAIGRFEPAWRRELMRELCLRAARSSAAAGEPASIEATPVEPAQIEPARIDSPSMESAPIDLTGIESGSLEPAAIASTLMESTASQPESIDLTMLDAVGSGEEYETASAVLDFPPLRLVPARAGLNDASGRSSFEADAERPQMERRAGPRHVPAGQRLVVTDLAEAREAAGLTIEDIARRTRIALTLLRELEQGSLKNWPEGVYRRSWLRAYSLEVGLQPEAVLAIFTPQLRTEDWPAFAESLRQARMLAEAEAHGGRRPFINRLLGAAGGLFAFVAMAGRFGSR